MEDMLLSSFGDLLKTFRQQRKITQRDLADRMDVHRNTIGTWERGDFLPESKTIVLELAKQLHLNEREIRQLLEASLTAVAPYWNVPYQRNPFFTGREEILHSLHEQLRQRQPSAPDKSYSLNGLGGIGKTQIAVEYTYRYGHEYSAIFWIRAETYEQIIAGFLSIAKLLNIPEQHRRDHSLLVAVVQYWLAHHHGWLIVFDNVDDAELIKPFLSPTRSGLILLTTRLHTLSPMAQRLEILPMTLEEGTRLLLCRSKLLMNSPYHEHRMSIDARAIVETMDGLPLALDQAGAYIEETQCSLADFLSLFQTHALQLLNERDTRSDHPMSVISTFTLAFEKFYRSNHAAAELLIVCAFLAPDAISEELILQGASLLSPQFQPMAADPLKWNAVLKEVLAQSLIRRHPQTRTLSVHRLVQIVLRGHLNKEAQLQWVQRVIRLVNQVLPDVEEGKEWVLWQRYLPHALICASSIAQWSIVMPEAGRLLLQTGLYLRAQARHNDAELLLQQALLLHQQLFDESHPQIATCLAALAALFSERGDLKNLSRGDQTDSMMIDGAQSRENTGAQSRALPICPYCQCSDGVVKSGNNRTGSRRFQCCVCHRYFTPIQHDQGHAPSLRKQAISLTQTGYSHRAVARQLGVHHRTISRWVIEQR